MTGLLIEKAFQLALGAHDGQVRKSDGSPYIAHPVMVAFLLAKYDFSEEVIAAALVHDVLEDTDISESELENELGGEVLEMVTSLSENKSLEWEERKKQYIEAVRVAQDGVKAVSISDKIHNAQSVIDAYREQGSAVWDVFNRGKEKKIWFEEEMLKMFEESWDHLLVDEYKELIEEMKRLD